MSKEPHQANTMSSDNKSAAYLITSISKQLNKIEERIDELQGDVKHTHVLTEKIDGNMVQLQESVSDIRKQITERKHGGANTVISLLLLALIVLSIPRQLQCILMFCILVFVLSIALFDSAYEMMTNVFKRVA